MMNTHQGWIVVVIAAVVTISLLLSFEKLDTKPQTPPTTRYKVTIAAPATPASGLVYVAHDGGFFAAEGLDVTLQKESSGKAALTTVLENRAMIGATSENPVMHAALRGEKVRLFATIMSTDSNYAIVARKDRAIKTIADLAGKRVGVTRGTNSEFLLEAMLSINNLSPDSIEVVHQPPAAIVDAIVSGEVDAISTWNPHLILAKKQLVDNHTVFYGRELYTATFNLVAMEALVEQQPEIIERVVRAMMRAAESVQSDPTQARNIIASHIKLDRSQFDELWDIFNYQVMLDQSLITTMESQAYWARSKESAATSTPLPNFFDIVYLDGLMRVDPKLVSIIH
jgi:NitT/TauT family transport system substrate-binding protein